MTPDLMLSLGKIAGSVILLAVVLGGVTLIGRRLPLQAEVARKLIHVSLGLYCLTFPWLFTEAWEVGATCALAVALFLLIRRGQMRASLGEGLHGVERRSYGEVLFAVSVFLLFYLMDGHYTLSVMGLQSGREPVLYLLPLIILTLCDASAAVVGVNYGKSQFRVEEGIKSWEGVAVFFVTAWLVSLIVLLLFSDLGRGDVIVLAFIAAGFGAMLEAASWRGLDNLFIPLGLYFLLANLTPRGLETQLAASGALVVVTAGLFGLGRAARIDRHVLASGAALFFCIAIFAGPPALIAPTAAAGAFVLAIRERRERNRRAEALSLILCILGVALSIFVIADLARTDTIFTFNLSFGAMTGAVMAALLPLRRWTWVAGAGIVGWLSTLPRLSVEPIGLPTLQFAALSLVLVFAAIGAVVVLTGRAGARRWLSVGGVSLAAGLLALPFSPA